MRKISKILILCITFCVVGLTVAEPALADVPYRTYTQNGYGELVETQTAYTPSTTILKIGGERLRAPEDLKITDDGLIYIADTGNKRIIVSNLDGELQQIIGEGILHTPRGLFVKADGTLYVADAGTDDIAGSIVVFNKDGKEINRYGKPDSPLYGSRSFKPTKISVSDGGTMYITSDGNTNGIIQITPTEGGQFLGYFGTNASVVSFSQIFNRFVYGDNTAGLSIAPTSISNLTIDSKGLIYTLTTSYDTDQPVKKLNIAGLSMLKTDVPAYDAISVAVGQYENIYVATTTGRVFEYNKEGSLLFVFGGRDYNEYRVGLFNTISAIDVDNSDRVFILDQANSEIQVFQQTEFTSLVHESLVLYQKGLYTQSKEPLKQIIMMNSLFDYANLAMGQATYQEGNYDEALSYYRLAKEKDGYSDAFWEVRNVWLRDNIVTAILIILAIIVLFKGISFCDRKWKILSPVRNATQNVRDTMFYKRLVFGKTFMRHPIDASYEVKRQGMQSYLVASILVVIFIIINIISKYFSGFLVKSVRDGYYDILSDIISVVGVLIIVSVVTYLICAINDGEGTLKNILCSYVYAISPYFILQPILFIAGNVVTKNEMFIIEFGNIIMFVWIALLIFTSIKEVNNYSMKETIKVIALTIFAIFVFAVMAFVMYVLIAQAWDFITSIYGEVVYRIAGA